MFPRYTTPSPIFFMSDVVENLYLYEVRYVIYDIFMKAMEKYPDNV